MFKISSISLFIFLIVCSCAEEDEISSPKPNGFMRIEFPKKEYVIYDSSCPFKFELPIYSSIEKEEKTLNHPCWFNINYKPFHAKLHLSYKQLDNDLRNYIEDSRELAIKHQIKASGFEQIEINRENARVYGLIYNIEGNTASSMQFFTTDSSKHFLRGSLYFNVAPNIDSLKIVIDFLKKDIDHLIQTLSWKE